MDAVHEFRGSIIPQVDLIRAYQANGDVRALDSAVSALCGSIGQFTTLMPARQLRATINDLRAWATAGFPAKFQFDATRDAIVPPADGEKAAYLGPVTLPNGESTGTFIEAFAVIRQDPDCLPELRETYPHANAVFQTTKLLAASKGLREGNCVVFFPENIPAATPCVNQQFAWFFFNRHVRIYTQTLSIVARLCGYGSPFAGEERLRSADVDPEAVYQARCVWGYMHDYFHHTGPRPLDKNLALKTKWRTGLLEELKVDIKSAIACRNESVPYGGIIFEYIILERLFRYPAEPSPLRNFDAGTGFALGTWLADHGLFTVDERGRRRLGSKAEIVAALQELVRHIEAIELIADDDAYRDEAIAFLFGRLLRGPSRAGDRYGGPRGEVSLWGAEVHV